MEEYSRSFCCVKCGASKRKKKRFFSSFSRPIGDKTLLLQDSRIGEQQEKKVAKSEDVWLMNFPLEVKYLWSDAVRAFETKLDEFVQDTAFRWKQKILAQHNKKLKAAFIAD